MTPDDLIDSLRFSRFYTLRLLDGVPASDWFRIPDAGVSHIAWQVGHLAVAESRLILDRVCGQRPEDGLIGDEFLAAFGAASVPNADPATYPTTSAIREVCDRVHERVLIDLPAVEPASLDEPITRPHAICKTKRDCIVWCARHELVHAGQIGLLRRQLGHAPVW